MKAFVSALPIRVATDKHKKKQSQGHTSGNKVVSWVKMNEVHYECQLLLVIAKVCSRITVTA